MKELFFTVLFLSFPGINFGQVNSRTLNDLSHLTLNTDTICQNDRQLPDSIAAVKQIDSICSNLNTQVDSIQTAYNKAVTTIDSETSKVNKKIDSLQTFNLPTRKYAKKLESLDQLRQRTKTQFAQKLDALKSKTTDKLTSLDLPPEYKEPLNELTNKINELNLNSGKIGLDELNIPGYSLPSEAISSLAEKSNLANIGEINLPNMETGDVVTQVQNEIKTVVPDNVGEVPNQAQAYQQDIENVTDGNLADVQKLPETLESEASKMEGIGELQKPSGVIDEHKARLDKLADPNDAKEVAIEMAKEAAVDHFAGKQEQLKAAMEKISKYKQKYSSVSSIKNLPKRPPNAMKGKPFIERLAPGLYLQYQQKRFYLIDVNPYLGYRISGRLTSGLGWNHRYALDDQDRKLNSKARIFGPRAYVDFKLGRGFIAHIEEEAMNTFVPSTLLGNVDSGDREWVWSFMTGLKKEYKIYKNLKGTALIQYNWFNRYYKAPYVDRLNSRIGFEYSINKAKGKSNRLSKN